MEEESFWSRQTEFTLEVGPNIRSRRGCIILVLCAPYLSVCYICLTPSTLHPRAPTPVKHLAALPET